MVNNPWDVEELKRLLNMANSSLPVSQPSLIIPRSMQQIAKQVLGGTPMADRELTWEEMLAQITNEEPEEGTPEPTTESETPRTFKFGKMSVTREAPQPVLGDQVTDEPTWTAPSYDELTQALPIYGMHVIIKEEEKKRYPSKLHDVTGIIIDVQGSDASCRGVIRKYKNTGKVESWEVSVRFENNETRNIQISRLERVISDKNMVRYTDDWDGVYRYFEEGSIAERDMLDQRAIIQKMPLQNRTVYTKEVQEKKYYNA